MSKTTNKFSPEVRARRIVGWKVSSSATASFVLDALEQAIHARRPGPDDGLIHHSDRGVQYLAMTYTQRLAEAKLVPSVGRVEDSLAETINGLYKAEVIWRQCIGGRNGNAALGRLVQQPSPVRPHRVHPAR